MIEIYEEHIPSVYVTFMYGIWEALDRNVGDSGVAFSSDAEVVVSATRSFIEVLFEDLISPRNGVKLVGEPEPWNSCSLIIGAMFDQVDVFSSGAFVEVNRDDIEIRGFVSLVLNFEA